MVALVVLLAAVTLASAAVALVRGGRWLDDSEPRFQRSRGGVQQ